MTACDAGSANFLAPVLKNLDAPWALYAQDPAAEIFSRREIPHQRVARAGWESLPRQGAEILSAGDFGAVVTGTSWGATLDKAATLAANGLGLPTTAIVEHWDIYRERFSRVEDGRITAPDAYLPASVWLPDEQAVAEAARAGLPRERLRAVGQPHLEAQAQALADAGPVSRNDDVVFISERVGGDFQTGSPLDRGFTEHAALDMLIEALDFSRFRLVIKLHPQEDAAKYQPLLQRGVPARLVKDCDVRKLILRSHRIVGMFSMLLLEAALIRRDVLSVMPGADPRLFIGNRIGATTAVDSVEGLRSRLSQPGAVGEGPGSAFGRAFSGSRERVAARIKELIA